jgi:nitrate/nitrite transport system substrate-binding protein
MTGVKLSSITRRAALAAGLAALALALAGCGSSGEGSETVAAAAIDGAVEKPNLKLGFIKLTDMAPLAIAKEKGSSPKKGSTSRSSRRPTGRCCSTG